MEAVGSVTPTGPPPSPPPPPAPVAAVDIGVAEVTQWLHRNGYGVTALELYREMIRCGGHEYPPLLAVAEASLTALASPTDEAAGTAEDLRAHSVPSSFAAAGLLVDSLKAYGAAEGPSALAELITSANTYTDAESTPPPQSVPLPARAALAPAVGGDTQAALRSLTERLQVSERQLKLTVDMLAERLPLLVASIDPMRKEVLLPLLRTVAVLSTSATGRAAARHSILTIFKRPTSEHRAAIVEEWVRVAQAAPTRAIEQGIAHELYTLVNARAVERRVLALDCAAALAPLVTTSPKVCYALCHGLLRPLSEDESASVRREVPACLAALWTGFRGSSPQPSLETDGVQPRIGGEADDPLTHRSSIQMELIIRLTLDSFSNSVRNAAVTQLREVIYPLCLKDGILLEEFVPLLMGYIAMESSALTVGSSAATLASSGSLSSNTLGAPGRPGSGVAPDRRELNFVTAVTGGGGARGQNKDTNKRALTPTTLALANTCTLCRLIHDASRCARVEMLGVFEAATDSDDLMWRLKRLRDTYVRVLLPTAYAVVSPLLSECSGSDVLSTRQLADSLCGLAASLAGPVALLDRRSWERVLAFLTSSVQAPSDKEASAAVVSTTPEEVSAAAGWLQFLNSFLIRLCGEQPAFVDRATHLTETATVTVGSAVIPAPTIGVDSTNLITRMLVNNHHLLNTETRLTICAHCIASLGQFVPESARLMAGLSALLWSLVESTQVTVRLRAVSLMTRSCALLKDDTVKTTLFCAPLLILINDAEYTVQEMAVRNVMVVAVGLDNPAAQDKLLQPALELVEASGCTSELTVAVLRQWEGLLASTRAEPREAFLYPRLSALMEQLAHWRTRPPAAERAGGTADEGGQAQQWEKAMLALHSLLQALLRCAVVTPSLVSVYLLPGVRHFEADGVLSTCSPTLRSRWGQLSKLYTEFMEANRGAGANGSPPNAANLLLSRVRNELKKHF